MAHVSHGDCVGWGVYFDLLRYGWIENSVAIHTLGAFIPGF